jgi:hypothetical protein
MFNVTIASGGDGQTGMWPDALVPDIDPIAGEKRNAFPFDVPANESRAVLVDIHVPQDAAAGTYTGVVNVTGGVTQQVPVKLVVWDFTVPSTSTLKSAFGMTWNGPCMGHGDGSCSGGVADLQLRARYVQAALDNHVSIYSPAMSGPVSAAGVENWTDYDTYAGPFLAGTAPTRLPGAKLTAVEIESPTPYGNGGQTKAWGAHFRANNWLTDTVLFNYVCDEPPLTCAWTDIQPRVNASIASDSSIPRLVTTTTAHTAEHSITGVNLYVPVINFIEDRAGTAYTTSQRSQYPANSWWYQSCMSFGCAGVGGEYERLALSGWPSYAIDTDGTRNRAMEWMSFNYDFKGELYYEVTQGFFAGDVWVKDYNFGGTGDGTLFYPGTPAKIGGQTEIPVESLRLKGIRDGMEDYELMNLAAQAVGRDQVLAITKPVYPVTYQATTSVAQIEAARTQLAGIILHALGKDTPPPAPTPVPPAGTGTDTTGSTGTSAGGSTPVKAATIFPHGGCSSTGLQSAWLALPALAMFALRRRRAARA